MEQFIDDGKKIIMWHGSDDTLVSLNDSVRAWKELKNDVGNDIAMQNTRLYIASGVNHCGGGPGADQFDLLTPMINWVEHKNAPQTVIAQKSDKGGDKILFTRPMCQYPAYPKYKGQGNIKDAKNFDCVTN